MKKYFSQIKISRFSAWVLFAVMIIYFVSGYGMTKGIIERQIATSLHKDVLPFIAMLAFIAHVSVQTKFALMRYRIWNKTTRFILIAFYVVIFILFLHFDIFYKPTYSNTVNTKPTTTIDQNITNNSGSTATTQAQQKVFTVSELAKYDGLNGNPAYAAVDGAVYDLSEVFINGDHKGHSAGQDLTEAFYSEHMKSILSRFPVVGILK
jgi:predicted heme/steroid binding protein